MFPPLVSIILLITGRERYVAFTLKCLLNQVIDYSKNDFNGIQNLRLHKLISKYLFTKEYYSKNKMKYHGN